MKATPSVPRGWRASQTCSPKEVTSWKKPAGRYSSSLRIKAPAPCHQSAAAATWQCAVLRCADCRGTTRNPRLGKTRQAGGCLSRERNGTGAQIIRPLSAVMGLQAGGTDPTPTSVVAMQARVALVKAGNASLSGRVCGSAKDTRSPAAKLTNTCPRK